MVVDIIDQYPSGFIIFAGSDSPEGVAEAIGYCRSNGLTPDHVTIVKTKLGDVLVKKK